LEWCALYSPERAAWAYSSEHPSLGISREDDPRVLLGNVNAGEMWLHSDESISPKHKYSEYTSLLKCLQKEFIFSKKDATGLRKFSYSSGYQLFSKFCG